MPTIFQFTQGTESRTRPGGESSPLLGRFRAVPPSQVRHGQQQQQQHLGLLSGGSVRVGYGALALADAAHDDGDDDDVDDDGTEGWRRRVWRTWVVDLWIHPRQMAVKRVAEKWYTRYGLLVVLPSLMTIAWCAIPFPQYRLPDDDDDGNVDTSPPPSTFSDEAPGHGRARVQVNFWFFLFVYYGIYNLIALFWITKIFNLYSLNWWPQSLGFPATVSLIAILSITVPIPIYYADATRFLTVHNTSWISWTFIIMAMPVAITLLILRNNERHIGLRNTLSETQRIFTTSWWTGDVDSSAAVGPPSRRPDRHRRAALPADDDVLFDTDRPRPGFVRRARGAARAAKERWFPASFVRFLWFCVALFVGLMAYVLGEAYAELYLRTLPHDSLETVVYVYGWVVTVHLLDLLTGWVLGIREGERVGSYPLSWVFKLYFMLTYQTYVRALYARLRSPKQFVILQVLSSTRLVVLTPIMMTAAFHKVLSILGLTTLSYGTYQKLQTRNVFIRFLSENTSMATFLGSILVLHFGANKDVYPYFAFDGKGASATPGEEDYDFNMIFWASGVTWGCELVASLVVRILVKGIFGVDVGLEGRLDLAVWPELLPTCVAATLHVLQNMLFSIIRLRFRA